VLVLDHIVLVARLPGAAANGIQGDVRSASWVLYVRLMLG